MYFITKAANRILGTRTELLRRAIVVVLDCLCRTAVLFKLNRVNRLLRALFSGGFAQQCTRGLER